MSLIGKMELLSMKCRGIGPHLAARGTSHEFCRVAAGTWCIFSSYDGDGHLKLGFVQGSRGSYVYDSNMEVLSMKCRGIGPHLAARG